MIKYLRGKYKEKYDLENRNEDYHITGKKDAPERRGTL